MPDAIALLVLMLLFVLTILCYLYRASVQGTAPGLRSVAIPTCLIVTAILLSIFAPLPLWLRVTRTTLAACGVVWIHITTEQIFQNNPRPALWRWPTRIAWFLVAITIGLDILRGAYAGDFNLTTPFEPTGAAYAFHGVAFGLLLYIALLVIRQYAISLRQAEHPAYVVRLAFGIIGYGCIAASALLVHLNLALYVVYGETYRMGINQFGHLASTGGVLFILVNLLPQSIFLPLMGPCIRRVAWRMHNEDLLYAQLHQQMVQLVPSVQLALPAGSDRLRRVRQRIEIGDARQILWSHIPHDAPLTPDQEARAIHAFLCQNRVFTTTGSYPPPPAALYERRHNRQVGRIVQRLAQIQPGVERSQSSL